MVMQSAEREIEMSVFAAPTSVPAGAFALQVFNCDCLISGFLTLLAHLVPAHGHRIHQPEAIIQLHGFNSFEPHATIFA
jgi:hypothetical protein